MTLICTIGDLMLDVLVLPSAPLAHDGDTPANIHLAAGGQAANVAAWAAALGAQSRLICVRGTDEATAMAVAGLDRQGVEICGPVIDGGGGVVVSIREVDGSRTMASDSGLAGRLEVAALDPAWIETVDVLHVSGYCLLREPAAEAAVAAARLARRVTLDLASAHDIEVYGAERFAAQVRSLAPDLIFANEAERAALTGSRSQRVSDAQWVADVEWVVKMGARGAVFPDGPRDAVPVEVVDATGAGDALAAGYLVGGADLAMSAAARCVANVGAMPAASERRL